MLYSSWHSSRFPPCSSTGDKQDTLVFILPFSLTIYTCILHEECNMTLAHHMMTLIENITTAGQYSIYPWALLLRDECIKLCLLRVEGDSNQSTAFVCSSKKEAIKDYIYPIDPPTLYTMSEIQADHHPPPSFIPFWSQWFSSCSNSKQVYQYTWCHVLLISVVAFHGVLYSMDITKTTPGIIHFTMIDWSRYVYARSQMISI